LIYTDSENFVELYNVLLHRLSLERDKEIYLRTLWMIVLDEDGNCKEGSRNKHMGRVYPEYRDFCKDMNDRMFDLMDVFRENLYDDPRFKGSYSIKSVLPVLVPDLNYESLDIRNGSMAMASWYDFVFKEEKDKKVVNDLLKYCMLDTLAMVRVFDELSKMI